jgi:phospholipid/cholesterol/gamma-HCH transport system substrate-binding protein
MESEARYLWVGGMVLALLLLLAGAVWWLQGGEDKEVRRYLVYFQNQSLEGLQINSDVRMQGIKVGKVMDYVILPNQAKTVRVVLEVDARTPVLEGVEAVVSRNLVTGLAAVDLNNVWKGGAPLAVIPKGEKYTVIEEGVPQMTRFTENLAQLGKTGQETLVRLNSLLSDGNQRAMAETLNNLAGLSGEARQLVPKMAGTLVATRHAAARLDETAREMGPVLRETGQLVKQAGQRLDTLAGETEATLRVTRSTLANLDTGLRDMQVQLRLSADLGMQELQRGAQALRVAGEAVQTTGRDFADPGRVLFGPNKGELGPGEDK